jgi:prepilin-type N-terminal cleavage/methylation domain-containing protein
MRIIIGRKDRSAGFTMVELLVAVILATIVTSAAMAVYVAQHKQMIVQDEVSDMQANIRAGAQELVTNIRMAGYNIPDALLPLEAYDTNPDTILIAYDAGTLRDVTLEWPMPQPSAELRCDGHDITGLYDHDWVYIFDPISENGEFFEVTEAQYASQHIQHRNHRLRIAYPSGSQVLKIHQYKYYIDNTDPDHPNLMRWSHRYGPQIFAENIVDLNIQYLLANGTIVDVPPRTEMVREVIIFIEARVNKADDEFGVDYRTRTLQTRVKVRNLGLG